MTSRAGRTFLVLFSLSVILFFSSCSKVMSPKAKSEPPELPDMIMENATYSFGESKRNPVAMQADKIIIYNRKTDKTELKNIKFYQYGSDQESKTIEMSGSCDNAVVTNNNSIAELSGNIKLYKKTDNFNIICDNLIWDNKNQTIQTSGVVKIDYQDETSITAKGFFAKLDSNQYTFDTVLEGRYKSEE